MMNSDAELVEAARGGDRTAMDALLRRHHDRIRAVCRRVLGSAADADDATQDALIKIVRNLDRFDGRSAFSTWCYRIATNAALDEVRRKRRRPVLGRGSDDESDPGDEWTGQADPDSETSFDQIADRDVLDGHLAAVPEDFRVPMVMRDVGDMEYSDIADALDIPVGTVKSRISRGRSLLAARLGNRFGASERPTEASEMDR